MGRSLITGGMGFIGIHLARELLAEGEEVVLFQRRGHLPSSASDLQGKVSIASCDINNWVQVVETVRKHEISTIYHSAALLSKGCEESAFGGFRVNVEGTMNILETARVLGVQNVIYVSSGATYGLHPPEKVYDDTPQKLENMYATTKACCERLGEQYHRQYGINFCGARFAMVVGPTRQISYHYGDWSGVIERAAQGMPYTVHSNPDSPCAYIYIKDLVRALVNLKKADQRRFRRRIYNFHGFMATLSQVTKAIRKHIPDAQIRFDWDRSDEMKLHNNALNYEMDNAASFTDLGWKPRFLLEEMVEDFIQEVKRGRAD
jgi:nucleoside-diphosphate-sugar epimerase